MSVNTGNAVIDRICNESLSVVDEGHPGVIVCQDGTELSVIGNTAMPDIFPVYCERGVSVEVADLKPGTFDLNSSEGNYSDKAMTIFPDVDPQEVADLIEAHGGMK